MPRNHDGSVHCGSGSINRHGAASPRASAHDRLAAGLFDRVDARPVHVRMREMRDAGATWGELCEAFGFATEEGARRHLRAAEARETREPIVPDSLPDDPPAKAQVMRAMKDAGATWAQIAERFGYASHGGAREFVLRQERGEARG